MIDFSPCDKCKTSTDTTIPLGYYYVRGKGFVAIKECECHIAWRKKEKLKIKAKQSNLWCEDIFLNYKPLEDYKGDTSFINVKNLVKFTSKFSEGVEEYRRATIYLYGPNGTQKTFLGQWVGLELLRRGFNVKYYLMNQILSKLSSNFESDPSTQEFRQGLLDTDLLIIDEAFSKDKVTLFKSGFQIPFLDSLLRERIDNLQKSVLFISNTPPEDIASQGFSASIQDFIFRKTKSINSIFEMKDSYMGLTNSFDVSKLFD
jgi:DNA replication protein DnaC